MSQGVVDSDDEVGPQPAPAGAGGWLRRAAGLVLWAGVLVALGLLALTHALPTRLHDNSQPFLTLATTAFFVDAGRLYIGLACLLALLPAALLRRWRLLCVATLAVLVAAAPTLLSYVPRETAPAPLAGAEPLRVMSMNLLASNRQADEILEVVREQKPEVLVLVEYAERHDLAVKPPLLSEYAYHFARPKGASGYAVFSRLPFAEPPELDIALHRSDRQSRVLLDWGGRTVALYALHLTSPQSMEAVRRNRREVRDLLEVLAAEEHPVILAGDFNFTDTSAHAAALRGAGLADTHRLAGYGRGSTWRVPSFHRRLPGFRIDHVFLSEHFTCVRSEVLERMGSDHQPIVADVAWAKR